MEKSRDPKDLALFFPCVNCQMLYVDHLDGKCLFGASTWSPSDIEKLTPVQWHAGASEVARAIEEYNIRKTQMLIEEKALNDLKDRINKLCRHVDRHGKNIITSGFMMNSCPLCGWNDY